MSAGQAERPAGSALKPETDGQGSSTHLFRLEGEYWTIAYEGAVFRLRDSKGLRCLAHLLRRPSEKVAAVDLLLVCDAARPQSPDPEHARMAVSKRIKAAITKIAAHHHALGFHLSTTIKTGYGCAYMPDPELPIAWGLSE